MVAGSCWQAPQPPKPVNVVRAACQSSALLRMPHGAYATFARVAAAMDALFASMQTRTDDAGRVGLFSRGQKAGSSQDVRRARAELADDLGADVVERLERGGQLVIHADESVLPEKVRGTGVRGWYSNGVLNLFPQNIEPGNAASVLFHEGTHRSAEEDPAQGLLLRALGMDGKTAMQRFERLRTSGSRRDRELAAEAGRMADAEVEQLRADGAEVGEERRQSEVLATSSSWHRPSCRGCRLRRGSSSPTWWLR